MRDSPKSPKTPATTAKWQRCSVGDKLLAFFFLSHFFCFLAFRVFTFYCNSTETTCDFFFQFPGLPFLGLGSFIVVFLTLSCSICRRSDLFLRTCVSGTMVTVTILGNHWKTLQLLYDFIWHDLHVIYLRIF